MVIPIHAKVSCSDGPCGTSKLVILKPTNEEITHLVVSDNSFPETDYLVPIKDIADSTPGHIWLDCSRYKLTKMPVFDKEEFVPSILTGYYGNPYLMWPFYAPAADETILEKDHIPANELPIRRGARVQAADGPIGLVDEFLIEPATDQITHLVMREGHLWGRKDVTIPVGQIDHYEENTVFLKLNKSDIEKLPAIPIRHSWARRA
jgi:hypothetical protein